MTGPPISAADLITAVLRLAPDPAALPGIARALGLAGPPAAASDVTTPAGQPAAPGPVAIGRTMPEGRGPASPDLDPPSPLDPRELTRPEVVQVEQAAAAPPRPVPRSADEVLAALPAPDLPRRPLRPGSDGLFPPSQQRSILSSLASTCRAGGELDVDAAVQAIAGRRPITVIPRLVERTTGHGVLVLADIAPAMRPFQRDVQVLWQALELVCGTGRAQLVPIEAGPGGFASTEVLDDAPPGGLITVPGRPVLVLTSLGAGHGGAAPGRGQADRRPWLALASQAASQGCPIVFLLPFPPDRWPGWAVRARLTMVQWDRAADARTARRAAAHARVRQPAGWSRP